MLVGEIKLSIKASFLLFHYKQSQTLIRSPAPSPSPTPIAMSADLRPVKLIPLNYPHQNHIFLGHNQFLLPCHGHFLDVNMCLLLFLPLLTLISLLNYFTSNSSTRIFSNIASKTASDIWSQTLSMTFSHRFRCKIFPHINHLQYILVLFSYFQLYYIQMACGFYVFEFHDDKIFFTNICLFIVFLWMKIGVSLCHL